MKRTMVKKKETKKNKLKHRQQSTKSLKRMNHPGHSIKGEILIFLQI